MNPSFYRTAPVLKDVLLRQKPAKILIGSLDAEGYAIYFKGLFHHLEPAVSIDRIRFSPVPAAAPAQSFFRRSFTAEDLEHGTIPETYDLIFITDLLERFPVDAALQLLDRLLALTSHSVLTAMPVLNRETSADGDTVRVFRKFHPTVFQGYDFSFFESQTADGGVQFYHIFKSASSTSIPQDKPQTHSDVKRKLKIAYLLPHKNLTGGVKCLLEQMRQLHQRGHSVYAVYKNNAGEQENRRAIPAWSDLQPAHDLTGEIVLRPDESYSSLPDDFDIIMLGFMNQLPEAANYSGRAAVVYWEQGYEAFYGDYGKLLDASSETLDAFRKIYQTNVHYLAVSEIVSTVLKSKYALSAAVLHNGIDTDFYRPNPSRTFSGTILLVGNPHLKFKGFLFALQALKKVWALGGRFHVRWACQTKPAVQNVPFPIDYFVLPPQEMLAELYREADIFLFTSLYESFPMPPFEAMASGLPVVATDCGGIHTYAVPGENILLVEQGDADTAASAVLTLLQDEELRNRLSRAGRKTAEHFTFDRIAATIEQHFYHFIRQQETGAEGIASLKRPADDAAPARPAVVRVIHPAELLPEMFAFDAQNMTKRELGLLLARIGCDQEEAYASVLEKALADGRFSPEEVAQLVKRNAPLKEIAYNTAGAVYYAMGQRHTAIQFFAHACTENKAYRDAVFNLAYCLIEFGRKEDALNLIHDSGCTDEEMLQLEDVARS